MRSSTGRFKNAGWGVFTHYLAETVADGEKTTTEDWDRIVNQFEVKKLARQLEEVEARYYFITIGQISGHYRAPNETYNSLVGLKPRKCSRRDLIRDLYTALNPLRIKLMVYLPSHAPSGDLTSYSLLLKKDSLTDMHKFRVGIVFLNCSVLTDTKILNLLAFLIPVW